MAGLEQNEFDPIDQLVAAGAVRDPVRIRRRRQLTGAGLAILLAALVTVVVVAVASTNGSTKRPAGLPAPYTPSASPASPVPSTLPLSVFASPTPTPLGPSAAPSTGPTRASAPVVAVVTTRPSSGVSTGEPGATAVPGATVAPCEPGDLTVTLSTNNAGASAYRFPTGTPVGMTLVTQNTSAHDCLYSQAAAPFSVADGAGDAVLWHQPCAGQTPCTAPATDAVLPAGTSVSQTASWDQHSDAGSSVSPGKYLVTATQRVHTDAVQVIIG